MNKLDEYWDWDDECHRGKPYPSGSAIVYGCAGAILSAIILAGSCWILQTLIQH
jgi:hypothetical protein